MVFWPGGGEKPGNGATVSLLPSAKVRFLTRPIDFPDGLIRSILSWFRNGCTIAIETVKSVNVVKPLADKSGMLIT